MSYEFDFPKKLHYSTDPFVLYGVLVMCRGMGHALGLTGHEQEFSHVKTDAQDMQPYYIRFKDRRLFGFGGIWERWDKQDTAIESSSLITTGTNTLMEPSLSLMSPRALLQSKTERA